MYRFMLNVVIWLMVLRQSAPDLLITLHDATGAPLAGATVIIRDAGGTQDLARATTDAQGQATFVTVAATDIRVVIQGHLPGGARFMQPGNDAPGIALRLAIGSTRLDLRADADGTILPDPRTMIALEPGIPVVTAPVAAFPTAPLPPRPTVTAIAAVTRIGTARPGAAGGAVSLAVPALGPDPRVIWLGAGLLIFLIGAGVALVTLMRRWRSGDA